MEQETRNSKLETRTVEAPPSLLHWLQTAGASGVTHPDSRLSTPSAFFASSARNSRLPTSSAFFASSARNSRLPTPDSRLPNSSAGFSLVEILVATTILLIIVMMISMVFQQTSGAYQSGTRRVRSQTVLRNILGAISRDMILAVDSRYYPGFENDFGSQSASFIALTGTPDGAGRRAPQWIEFSYAGGAVKRSCTDMVWQSAGVSKWILSNNPDGKEESMLNPNQNEKLTDFSFAITADPDGSSTLPLRVDVEGSIQTDGKDSYVSGRSAGKDRKWGTATEPGDDIIVGGQ